MNRGIEKAGAGTPAQTQQLDNRRGTHMVRKRPDGRNLIFSEHDIWGLCPICVLDHGKAHADQASHTVHFFGRDFGVCKTCADPVHNSFDSRWVRDHERGEAVKVAAVADFYLSHEREAV